MDKSKEGLTRWLVYAPVLVCAAVMLPRLLSPQFGLLDDGLTLSVARQIAAGHWTPGAEGGFRFRPVYWFYYGVIYILEGQNPLAFFLGNLLIYTATTAVLISLVRRIGDNRWQAFATGLLFALAGPVFENYYTLSKGELLQVLFIDLIGVLCPVLAKDPSVCSQLPPVINLTPVSYSWEIFIVNQ